MAKVETWNDSHDYLTTRLLFQVKKQETHNIEKDLVQLISKRTQRDKDATQAGSPPASSLKNNKRRKTSEAGKSSKVVKPHAGPALTPSLPTKKQRLESPPGAPVKKAVAVTPPNTSVFPKVSETSSKSRSSAPNLDDTDEDQDPATFISFEPHRLSVTGPNYDDDSTISEFSVLFELEWDEQMADQSKNVLVEEHNKVVRKLDDATERLKNLRKDYQELQQTGRQQSENQGRALMEAQDQLEAVQTVLKELKVSGKAATAASLKAQILKLTKSLAKVQTECATHKKNNIAFKEAESGLLLQIEDLKRQVSSKSSVEEGSAPCSQEQWEKFQQELAELQTNAKTLARDNDLWATKWEQYVNKSGEKALEQAIIDFKAAKDESWELAVQKKELESKLEKLSNVSNVLSMVKELEEANKKLVEENTSLSNKNKSLTAQNKKLAQQKSARPVSDDDSATTKVQSENSTLKQRVATLERQLRLANRGNRTDSEPVTPTEVVLTPDERDRDTIIKENVSLKTSNKRLTAQLEECTKVLKNSGKFVKSEVSARVEKKAKDYISAVAFHTYKFATTDKMLTEMMQVVYAGIKGDPELAWEDVNAETHLPFSEFKRIYSATCREKLNTCRQFFQTRCLNAGIGTFYTNYAHLCLSNVN